MTDIVLAVADLSKTYKVQHGLFRQKVIAALKPMSFELQRGKTLAVIGETGSGKSTLAKLLAGIESPTTGQIVLDQYLVERGKLQRCSCVRLIFQDPASSINPALKINVMLDDVLRLNGDLSAAERRQKIRATLLRVGMLPEHGEFYPNMLSGGQLQRVAMARALIVDPQVLVLDEALSSLDPSVRAQTVNLLIELQQQSALSFILISNNLSIVKHISDDVVVMCNGAVVESGATETVFAKPQHDITQRMLANYAWL